MLNGPIQPAGVPGRRVGSRTAFTLIELLVVIAIIGILSALVLGVGNVATKQKKRSVVKAQLEELKSAIDRYHHELGNYPPDNPNANAISPLYYELVGTVYDAGSQTFRVADEPVSSTALVGPRRFNGPSVQMAFNQAGFLSAQDNANKSKSYLTLRKDDQKRTIPIRDTQAFVLAVPTEGYGTNILSDVSGNKFNPWHYDAHSPGRHNPNSYDLWAEIQIGDTVEIIGNWNSAK